MNRQILFVTAILASAFLIFLVQPMVGKRILPWFGGAPSVWMLCLAFYQTTLFLGYAYAHVLIRYVSPFVQVGVHTLIVALAILVLPVLPDELWQPAAGADPTTIIIAMLASNVALPFLVLASTGPLVQAWFARAYPHRSPYPLYAVSNLGSLAALFAYPFLFEPRLGLSTTGTAWGFAFVATSLSVLACAVIAQRSAAVSHAEAPPLGTSDEDRLAPGRVALWVLLAGCAVILLMGVTNSVCLDVASVPFLWVLPLSAYLLTFIVCFGSERAYRRTPYVALTLASALLTLGLPLIKAWVDPSLSEIAGRVVVQLPAWCALLFGTCMVLHGELYRLRPPPRSLTAFYLCVSGGGALGGLFVGMLAPIVFDDYYEVPLGLGLASALFLIAGYAGSRASDPSGTTQRRWAIAAPIVSSVALFALWPRGDDGLELVYKERGFFGVLKVVEVESGTMEQRQLVSGTTLHGIQFVDPASRMLPSVYYGRATGIGLALAQRPRDRGSRIGLVGLGVGTLAAYGRNGDLFRYYEIDPDVMEIARHSGHFSFLEESRAEIEYVVGDGRLALQREQDRSGSQQFDFLVLDAFNSDAIPVHLLTLEAFRSYAHALAPDGVLAVHISNRHFDLFPLVSRVGAEVGLSSVQIATKTAPGYQSKVSFWVFLSADLERLASLSRFVRSSVSALGLPPEHYQMRRMNPQRLREHAPLWTDDYSDLLSVIRSSAS